MTDAQARLAEMRKQSTDEANKKEDRAQTWKPSEGDVLAGTVKRIDHVMTSNGDSRLIVVENVEDGDEYTVWCSSRMLKDLVIQEAPAVGALIVVEYHGKFPVQSNPSYSFNKYTMIVDGEPDFDAWDKVSRAFFRKQQSEASTVDARVQSFGPEEAPF